MSSAQAGLVLNGKYRLERPIGRGGMGWVWRAEHLQWRAPVAVKLIDLRRYEPSGDVADASPQIQRFFSEARSAATIRSPHVVQILDHGVDLDSNLPFIVMELLDGETLEGRLNREGRLDAATAANILSQVARALTRVHEADMVHRDLKPSNIFLVPNEEELVVKVLDFGIAKTRSTMTLAPITATGEQMGTPFYMSPEQVRGQREVDFRADIWAFGVIAFECLTGVRPFTGETLGDLSLKICAEPLPLPSSLASVPPGFDAWFSRSVERDRERTFTSAREAAEALRRALRSSSSAAGSSRPSLASELISAASAVSRSHPLASTTAAVSSTKPRRAATRKRWTATAIAVALASGLVGVGIKLRQDGSSSEENLSDTQARSATVSPPAPSPTEVPLEKEPPASVSPSAPPANSPPGAVEMARSPATDKKSAPSLTRPHLIAKPKVPTTRPTTSDPVSPGPAALDRNSPNDGKRVAPAAPPPKSLDDLIESRY